MWFGAFEFFIEEVGVRLENRVKIVLRHFDGQSHYRIKSAQLEDRTDWELFKSRLKSLFVRNEAASCLQERLFAIQQQPDESAARYGARILDRAIKNLLLLSLNDQQQVIFRHLLN